MVGNPVVTQVRVWGEAQKIPNIKRSDIVFSFPSHSNDKSTHEGTHKVVAEAIARTVVIGARSARHATKHTLEL